MRISKIIRDTKCDTVLCNKDAHFELETGSYKGNSFLCDDCFKSMQKLFKRTILKDE